MLTKDTPIIIRSGMYSVNPLFFVFAALLFSLLLSGCATNFAHHMAIRNVSGIKSVYDNLESPTQSDGRLVIYWEKKPLMATSGGVKITGDDGYMDIGLATQTGAIVDLPSGQYVLSMGGLINKREITFSIEAGQTVFCNTETLYSFITGPMSGSVTLVPVQEGLSDLAENDIRCCLNSCQVLTLIPDKDRNQLPYQIEQDHKQAKLRSKDFDFNNAKSRIYVTRDMYTLGMVKAGIDATPGFSMGGNSYFCFEVNPGFHVITVSDPNGKRGFKVKTEAGESSFFHTDTLDYLGTAEGMELVAHYDLLKEGFLFE